MSKQPFYTPVRRNHIIGPAGIGSLIVTRNGITALVCGLPTWLKQAPLRGADEAARKTDLQRLLDDLTLHDSNAEKELAINRLIQPPVYVDEIGFTPWFIPAIRFPLAEYCTAPRCRTLHTASAESPSIGRCQDTECNNNRKRPSTTQQIPLVIACPDGHLDEPDFTTLTHPNGPCNPRPRLQYKPGNTITRPEITCRDCGARTRLTLDNTPPCTGRRTWIPGLPPDPCGKKTTILDRTDTRTYYADIRSYLHIPASKGLRDSVLRWLQNDHIANALRQVGPSATPQIHQRATSIFPDLTEQQLTQHLQHLANPQPQETGPESEIAALTSGIRGTHTSDGPPILDAEAIPTDNYDQNLIGPHAPITRVIAVHRLAETRTLAGFTRIEPPNAQKASTLTGYQLLWGRRTPHDATEDWLPGMRLYGEGIYLQLNQDHVTTWTQQARSHLPDINLNGQTLTPQFQLAHTLAHLLMNAASLECGYPIASLRDRIYTTPNTTALLIYTGEGDILGTLGGLVELAQPGSLEQLLHTAYNTAHWCTLDPVCLNPVQHIKHATAGACHQCCLLPETTCASWNKGLDRATLVGRDTLAGFLNNRMLS
jgi:hypothetical protein